MNIVEHYAMGIGCCGPIVEYVTKYDTSLCRGDLDSRFDALERVRPKRILHGSFNKLQVAKRGKLDRQVLKSLSSLVDHENICTWDISIGLSGD